MVKLLYEWVILPKIGAEIGVQFEGRHLVTEEQSKEDNKGNNESSVSNDKICKAFHFYFPPFYWQPSQPKNKLHCRLLRTFHETASKYEDQVHLTLCNCINKRYDHNGS